MLLSCQKSKTCFILKKTLIFGHIRILQLKNLILAISICSPFLAIQEAIADCGRTSGGSGYMYVWASCLQEAISHRQPKNICEAAEGDELYEVWFYSSVIYDEVNNSRYPAGQFFDEIQIQHNLTMNGKASACYPTRDAATDNKRNGMANSKRSGGAPVVFKTVYLDDS